MEIMFRRQNDPTAVDALSYIDEDGDMSGSEPDSYIDQFEYEDTLNAAIDFRRAATKIGMPIDDNNINALLEAAGIKRLRPDDINRIVALL